MSEKLTHWKKNNDPRYISGEDLKDGIAIGKGLAPEMVVMVDRFEDSQTFDQNTQAKVVKTGFWLKTLDGKALYKPLILNNTNAAFCIKEFGSSFMEHWLNKPMVLYALADKRHGFVSRLKKYFPPVTVSDVEPLLLLLKVNSLDDLRLIWDGFSVQEKKLPSVVAKKEELKNKFK